MLRTLDDRVVVALLVDEHALPSGLVLPDDVKAKKPAGRGLVISVGPGRLNRKTGDRVAMQVKVGDTVYFDKWAGKEVEGGGAQMRIVRETDIFFVLESP